MDGVNWSNWVCVCVYFIHIHLSCLPFSLSINWFNISAHRWYTFSLWQVAHQMKFISTGKIPVHNLFCSAFEVWFGLIARFLEKLIAFHANGIHPVGPLHFASFWPYKWKVTFQFVRSDRCSTETKKRNPIKLLHQIWTKYVTSENDNLANCWTTLLARTETESCSSYKSSVSIRDINRMIGSKSTICKCCRVAIFKLILF